MVLVVLRSNHQAYPCQKSSRGNKFISVVVVPLVLPSLTDYSSESHRLRLIAFIFIKDEVGRLKYGGVNEEGSRSLIPIRLSIAIALQTLSRPLSLSTVSLTNRVLFLWSHIVKISCHSCFERSVAQRDPERQECVVL